MFVGRAHTAAGHVGDSMSFKRLPVGQLAKVLLIKTESSLAILICITCPLLLVALLPIQFEVKAIMVSYALVLTPSFLRCIGLRLYYLVDILPLLGVLVLAGIPISDKQTLASIVLLALVKLFVLTSCWARTFQDRRGERTLQFVFLGFEIPYMVVGSMHMYYLLIFEGVKPIATITPVNPKLLLMLSISAAATISFLTDVARESTKSKLVRATLRHLPDMLAVVVGWLGIVLRIAS